MEYIEPPTVAHDTKTSRANAIVGGVELLETSFGSEHQRVNKKAALNIIVF